MRTRRFAIGAELLSGKGVHFRVWAPRPHSVELLIEEPGGRRIAERSVWNMQREEGGYRSCLVPHAAPGTLYRYRLDGEDYLYPDPASRFQPAGPHGPSQVIDSSAFDWTDAAWKGVASAGQVIYEMHIGSFTPEGTFRAAAAQLPALAQLGITLLELMPVAEFDGAFGWGYDGVALFAPYHHYGAPDDLRHFVDCAHAAGMGVIHDVVYNHFGPSGCYHGRFAESYFTARHVCEWGEAIDFDGEHAAPVREFFISNARYWIEEFHFDGLRLDATQQIFDSSPRHVVAEIVAAVRQAANGRGTYVVAENEPQHAMVARAQEAGGHGVDALWNDDFHHTAAVALKGKAEAYFTDYKGSPQEFVSAAKWGFLYQGQWYSWQKQRRGTPALDMKPSAFVCFLQNHDQIANSGFGKRMHQNAAPGAWRALTALLLLGPATPMLFQGQEFAASTPFLYFADHAAELASLVSKGRMEFLHQFPCLAAPATQPYLAEPHDPETFLRCKLDHSERERHHEAYALHRDLLQLRKNDPVLSDFSSCRLDGAVLSETAFALRFFASDGESDRLLLVNLGADLPLTPAPEPLLAPPINRDWRLLWSSEHPCYGGNGIRPVESKRLHISGRSALLLAADPIGRKNEHV